MAWHSRAAFTPPGSWQMFGIPIYIDRSWFFIAIFLSWNLSNGYFPAQYEGLHEAIYWVMGVFAAVLLFGCVLLHELGHSLVAKRHGIPVARVTLFFFGGIAHIAREPDRPAVELKIALAGPLVSLAIAAACFTFIRFLPVHNPAQLIGFAILRYLAIINTAILVFNLLPGFPLDGGRVMRALIWAVSGNLRKATRIASAIGAGLGWALIGLGVWVILREGLFVGGIWYVFLGFFLRNAARASFRRAA